MTQTASQFGTAQRVRDDRGRELTSSSLPGSPPCFQAGRAGWPRCRAPRSGCRRGEAASQIWERTRDRKMRRPGAWACAQPRRTRIPAIWLRCRSSSSMITPAPKASAMIPAVSSRGGRTVTTEHKQPSTCTGARRLLSSATPLLCVSSIAFVQRWECGALRTWRGVHLEPADVLGRVSGNCPDTTPPLCLVGAAARCVGEEEDDEEDKARVKAARDNVVRLQAPTSSSVLRVQGG